MSQVAPLNIRIVKYSTSVTVSSAAGGDGQALADTSKSLYIALRNIDTEDCEFKVSSGAWLPLRSKSAANLDINLSTTAVYLRKAPHGRDTSVVLDTAVAIPEYLVGDDDIPLMGTVAAEGAGVHYNATPAANVAAFNAALSRRGVVTLSTPGQYLIGGPEQGGLLLASNSTLICGEGVEVIVADQTHMPLIRNISAYAAGTQLLNAINYVGGAFGYRGRVDHAGIHLLHPLGSWIAVLGLSGASANNRGWQGVYQVTEVGADQIFFNLLGIPPNGTNSASGAVIYPADNNIRIVGGMWDGNETGQAASGYNDGDPRQFVNNFRNAHGILVQGTTYRRGQSWCIGVNNIRDSTFRQLGGDIYTDGLGTADVLFQGAGGSRNVLVEDVSGTSKDNLVAWSLDSMSGGSVTYPNYDAGDTYDITFRRIHSYNNYSAIVALWGNTDSRHHNFTIDGVTGRCSQGAVQVHAGYAPTNMLNINGGTLKIKNVEGSFGSQAVSIKTDGVWDSIEVDTVRNDIPTTQPALVQFIRSATTQAIKRVAIRNVGHFVAGTTVNRNTTAIEIRDSNIDDLRIEDLPPMRLGANVSLVQFAGTLGTIKRAVVEKVAAESAAAGDSFLVSCENTNATALVSLTIRDASMTGTASTGGVIRQTPTGKVTTVRLDNAVQTGGEAVSVLEGTGATVQTVSVA